MAMENKMLSYIERKAYTMLMLLDLAKIKANDTDTETFEDITVPVLISMYCSPGLKFAAQPVKDDLQKCNIKPINTLKMYTALQCLSKLATNDNITRATITTSPDTFDLTNVADEEIDDDLGGISLDLRSSMEESPNDYGSDDGKGRQLENEDYLTFFVRTEEV
mgnify:CR=1 FL=1